MISKDTRGCARTLAQFLLVAMTVVGGAKADAIQVVDQQNTGPTNGPDSQGGVIFGQSFTPTLSLINVFEVDIGDMGAIAEVQILDGVSGFDGLGGTVLGTSGPVAVDVNQREPFQFLFSRGIALTPGNTYVAKIFATSGIFAPGLAGISTTLENQYSSGQLFEAGASDTTSYLIDSDAVFREGLIGMPEVPTTWTVAVGLAIAILGARRLGYSRSLD